MVTVRLKNCSNYADSVIKHIILTVFTLRIHPSGRDTQTVILIIRC